LRSLFAGRTVIFLSSACVTSVLFINFCAAVFQCGCLWLWAGADAACNIHRADTPHCPWCEHNAYVPYLAIVIAQGVASYWPSPIRPALRAAVTFAIFPALGGVLALAYGAASGYWKS
jgi:hypothetical protein